MTMIIKFLPHSPAPRPPELSVIGYWADKAEKQTPNAQRPTPNANAERPIQKGGLVSRLV